MNKKLFLIPLIFSILFSGVALAEGGESTEYYGGILKDIPRDPSKVSTCHLFVLLDNIIDFILFQLNIAITLCLFVYIGVLYYFGGDDPSKISKAQATFRTMMIGLFIMYGAWLFISLVLGFLGISQWVGFDNGAFVIKCIR